jgi:hypothetical protein
MNITVKLLDTTNPICRIKVNIKCKAYFPSAVFAYLKETTRNYYCTYNANVSDTCQFIKGWMNKKAYEYL